MMVRPVDPLKSIYWISAATWSAGGFASFFEKNFETKKNFLRFRPWSVKFAGMNTNYDTPPTSPNNNLVLGV